VKVGFRQSFTRDLAKVKDRDLLRRVKVIGDRHEIIHFILSFN
jgi:hypothetical protein